MKKIINPCTCQVYDGRFYNAFASISYHDGRLSIHGVVGPRGDGNCYGGAGQCVDEIRAGTPKAPWTAEMLQQFCDIWDRWHLNDLRPWCSHMKEMGWDKQASEEIVLRHYRMTSKAKKKQDEAERAALTALRNGKVFMPTKEQSFYAALPYSVQIYGEAPATDDEFFDIYEPKKKLYAGDTGPEEIKTRGWVYYGKRENDTAIKVHSELGLLDKPCPVCGYKYGTAWQMEEVPVEVISWLENLPDTPVQPAWV